MNRIFPGNIFPNIPNMQSIDEIDGMVTLAYCCQICQTRRRNAAAHKLIIKKYQIWIHEYSKQDGEQEYGPILIAKTEKNYLTVH